MKLLVVRHGHDLPGANGDSALSLRGRKQAAKTAERIVDMGISKVDVAYSSPSRRAVETLSEIADLIPTNISNDADELQPGATTDSLASLVWRHWQEEPDVLLLVGHEPQLSNTVLRWCGLPENSSSRDTAPWVLTRGEGMLLSPSFQDARIQLSSSLVTFLGHQRSLPRSSSSTRAGVF